MQVGVGFLRKKQMLAVKYRFLAVNYDKLDKYKI
jgi:hypothetical protein